MSYEMLRNEYAAQLTDLPEDQLRHVLNVLDIVAIRYDIQKACTDLSVSTDPVPQIVRMHIAAKSIEGKSKTTLSARLIILRQFFGTVRIPYDRITANDIRVYLHNYREQRHVSDSTLDRIRCNIKIFYSWCVDEGYLDRNPAAKIGVIKHQDTEREPLTSLQLEIVRSVCRTAREKALVDFFYSTACRVSEFCDMLISDVDLDNQTVHIRHGKGDKARTSYLNAEAVISLRTYLATRKDDCPYLFVSDYRPVHQLTPANIQRIFRDLEPRTGMQLHLHPHKFRHTAATEALAHGMPVEQVQRFLGHSKIDTTLIYAKISDDAVKESHRRALA